MGFVDELEDQRKELEARRLVLEERFKLRLATAQEFGLLHERRLGRVRDAFAAQCSVAQRRNQDIVNRVRQRHEAMSGSGTRSGASASSKRLTYHTERFFAATQDMYLAWQEKELHRKAMQLRDLEEERFLTDQRNASAREAFERRQAVEEAVEEQRRQLAAARARERDEATFRRARHDRARSERAAALLDAVDHAHEIGRCAWQDALAEVTNRPHGDGFNRRASERPCSAPPARRQEEFASALQKKSRGAVSTGRTRLMNGRIDVCMSGSKEDQAESLSKGHTCRTSLSRFKSKDEPSPEVPGSTFPNETDFTPPLPTGGGSSESFESLPPVHDEAAICFADEALSSMKDCARREGSGEGKTCTDTEHYQEHQRESDRDSRSTGACKEREALIGGDNGSKSATFRAAEDLGAEGFEQGNISPDYIATCRVVSSGDDHAREWKSWAEAGVSKLASEEQRHLPCPIAARLLISLSAHIERLALPSSTKGAPGERGGPCTTPSRVLDAYRSAGAEPAAYRRAALSKALAATSSGGEAALSDVRALDLSTSCSAAIELIGAHAHDIMPLQALSGLVTVDKARTHHRRTGEPGKLQLFDAVAHHVRRLADSGKIDPHAVAAAFEPCFERVAAETNSGDVGRVRRKVSRLLQQIVRLSSGVAQPAAGASFVADDAGASTDRSPGVIASTERAMRRNIEAERDWGWSAVDHTEPASERLPPRHASPSHEKEPFVQQRPHRTLARGSSQGERADAMEKSAAHGADAEGTTSQKFGEEDRPGCYKADDPRLQERVTADAARPRGSAPTADLDDAQISKPTEGPKGDSEALWTVNSQLGHGVILGGGRRKQYTKEKGGLQGSVMAAMGAFTLPSAAEGGLQEYEMYDSLDEEP